MRAGTATIAWLGAVALFVPAAGSRVTAGDDSPTLVKASVFDPVRVRADADAAQRDGKWEKALDLYLRLYFTDRQPELRDQIRFCLRHATQTGRLRDPAFQQFLLSLPPSVALDVYLDAVSKLTTVYADRDRASTPKLFALGLDELDRALSDPNFRKRHLDTTDEAKIQKFQQSLRDTWRTRLPTNPREARHAARELVGAAQRQISVRTPSAVVLELMCGACAGLDEYTAYLTPTGTDAPPTVSPVVELLGYGLLVSAGDAGVTVEGVNPGSWAALHTPLRKGDKITKVNGRALQPATVAALGDALRAAQAAGHELEVPATGGPVVVGLPVPAPTVVGADIVNAKEGVGYFRLTAFREHTPAEIDQTITSLKAREMRALVIDLRGNFGGHFLTAVHAAQRFVPSGTIVATHGQLPEFDERLFTSQSGMAAYDFPVVLIVDTKTMSSAEIFAAALKDQGRATVVGVGTFGKGAIQCPFRLEPLKTPTGTGSRDAGSLVITVGTATSPRGNPINGGGVAPHVHEADPARQLELAITKAIVGLATENR